MRTTMILRRIPKHDEHATEKREIVSSSMSDLANIVVTANNVGVDLILNHMDAEASFHFQLAIEKVMEIPKCELSCSKTSNGSEDEFHCGNMPMDFACIEDLSNPGTLRPLNNKTSTREHMLWLKCASLVSLRNFAIVSKRMGFQQNVRKILECASKLLDDIYTELDLRRDFYQGRTNNVVLSMSLHMLLGELMLTNAGAVSSFPERRRRWAVKEAMKHYARAIDLGRVYFGPDARENAIVAQALSQLAYCLMSEGEESLASVVYGVSAQEYSRIRGEERKSCVLKHGEENTNQTVKDPSFVLGAAAA